MSIEAWMTDANVTVTAGNLEQAYQAVKEGYSSKIISYYGSKEQLDDLLSQSKLAGFFEKNGYSVEVKSDSIIIGTGDIDTINDELCKLFETLAPFVEEGSFIHIENEEEQCLNLTFDGEKVSYEGDAY